MRTFADSNDGGRDGAFYGTWQQPPDPIGVQDVPDGPFVLQCKHTKKADTTLAPSDLDDEFTKVQALVERGLCGSYVLLTNARVSGTSEATIRRRLLDAGVVYPLVLDGQWICDTIATRQRLRTFVPRVYGLGDLSQILDERAYTQAQALLGYLREELATFVVTDAYRRAVRAVQDHGFVLLLGEPGVGKSVIAETLAMTALDAWGCLTVKAPDAAGFVRYWNPLEPNQFFWIDDAFGSVRHERHLTDNWARHMREVMTAVRGGAKVVLTSRDYIYRDARRYLKESAYPLLHEQQVVVDAAQLSPEERRQILYNHIKLGDQPREVRSSMKPHLHEAADADPFYPEAARRLGLQAFTLHLQLNGRGIGDFMTRPSDFLREVYDGLDPDEKTALALTYQAGEYLSSPLDLDLHTAQHDVLTRLGGTIAGVSRALHTLTGTFLRHGSPPSHDTITGWSFRHPTLQEGFAAFLATDLNLIQILLSGQNWRTILSRIDCDTGNQAGTLLRVPPSLYLRVIEILRTANQETLTDWLGQRLWHGFLASRCSDKFLTLYTQAEPTAIDRLTWFGSFLNVVDEPQVLARLQQADLIEPPHHQRIVERVTELAVESPDAGWTWLPEWEVLLTESEREQLLSHVKQQLPSRFDQILQDWRNNYNPDETDPHTYFDELEIELNSYQKAFANDADATSAIEQALEKMNDTIWAIDDEHLPQDPHAATPPGHSAPADEPHERSIFDDIDDD
ncbi:ATP-binding protein [Streptomyces ferrugineus]|uniref:ATP-binding protein n=1 Tax=Streptomyces ferrugineus TaxID=1413221 RepID=A0A7M2SAG2_9ACTN|nr:ATP-binding protein [Streptomyces ferrugineus]QOV33274.1 ATP-binding protein [Streptomyces ferrugineus]